MRGQQEVQKSHSARVGEVVNYKNKANVDRVPMQQLLDANQPSCQQLVCCRFKMLLSSNYDILICQLSFAVCDAAFRELPNRTTKYVFVRRDLPTLDMCKEKCVDVISWCRGVMYHDGQCSFLGKEKLLPQHLVKKKGAMLYILSHDCNDTTFDEMNLD